MHNPTTANYTTPSFSSARPVNQDQVHQNGFIPMDCQCIFRQALLYLESNDAVESAELVVGDYLEVDWKLVGKIFVELESDFWRWYIWMTAVVVHNYA
jgi:hypothetical protein